MNVIPNGGAFNPGAGLFAGGGNQQGRRRLSYTASGGVVDESGRPVPNATLTPDDIAAMGIPQSVGFPGDPTPPSPGGYQNPGAGQASQLPFLTPPASRQFLDSDRAGWSPPGYKNADEALAASLAQNRKTGDSGGFAIQGPGGQYFTSNEDRDRANAVSANPLDQFQAFKTLAPKMGIFTGPNGAYGPDGMDAFAKLSGMATQGKTAQAALEENLAKQYALTTRATQDDSLKMNEQILKGRQEVEKEGMHGQTARDVARLANKGGMATAFASREADLASQGNLEQAKAYAEASGNIMRRFDQERSGLAGGPAAAGLPGVAAPSDKPFAALEAAQDNDALAVKLGLKPKVKGKDGVPDQFNQFSADAAMQELMKSPARLKDPAFRDLLRKGGGSTTADAMRAMVEQRLLQQVMPSSFGGIAPDEQTVDGLTITHKPRGEGQLQGFDTTILSPGGRQLSQIKPPPLPLAQAGAGVRRVFPRIGATQATLDQERQTLSALYKAMHGIE